MDGTELFHVRKNKIPSTALLPVQALHQAWGLEVGVPLPLSSDLTPSHQPGWVTRFNTQP